MPTASDAPRRGRIALYVSFAGLAVLGLGPLLAYAGIVPGIAGLGIFAASVPVGLVAVVLGIVAIVRRGRVRGAIALVAGLLPPVVVVAAAMAGHGAPPINDITTDLADPPPIVTSGAPYPKDFVPIVRRAYPHVKSLVLDLAPKDVYALALSLVKKRGWKVEVEDPGHGYIEATATTRLFHFHDDVAIRIRGQGDRAVVDLRSRSRVGKGDLGTNARRIRHFLEDLARAAGGALASAGPRDQSLWPHSPQNLAPARSG